MRARSVGPLLLGVVSFVRPASAQQRELCIGAYEQAQKLRAKGTKPLAHEQASLCLRVCPSNLSTDCATWKNELERELIRVKIVVEGETKPARILLDGRIVGEGSSATVFAEPGPHVVRLEGEGGHAVELSKEVGAKGPEDEIRVQLDRALANPVVTPVSPVDTPSKAAEAAREPGTPVAVYVLAGVSALSFVGAVGFLVKGQLDRSDLLDTCGHRCSDEAIDGIAEKRWISGGLGVAALTSGVLAYVIYASSRSEAPRPTTKGTATTAWSLTPGGMRLVF